jgi:hypothetical protein
MHEFQAGGQLGAVGVTAGLFLGEDPSAVGGFERVELTFEFLTAGGDPGVADADVGQHGRFGSEQFAGFLGRSHGGDALRKRLWCGC